MINFDFSGRRCIVTGGSRGIGRGVADRLLASGAQVFVWDLLPPSRSSGAFASDAQAFSWDQVDVTDEASVASAMAKVEAEAGGVDVLINAAGVSGPTKPLEEFSVSEWRRVVGVNLDSVFLCCRAVIPAMRGAGYGRIVSVASVAGKQGNPNMAGYSAGKAAVIGLTKALGLELAGTGILVNCVTPGLVRTELLAEMSDEAISLSESKIPLKRMGTIQEIAAQILWAASEECSFATGAAFDSSGGRSSF